jgi:alpha-galactosidase
METIKDIGLRLGGKKSFDDWLDVSGERAVEIISAIMHNKHKPIESGVVYNKGAISNLPDDAAVEVPIYADAGGILPMHIGDLPAPLARILTPQVCVQQMAVEAAVYGDRKMALQALLMDPVVNSADAAVKILDELWEINKPYIRRCI